MKRNYKILILVLLMAVASCSFTTKSFESNDPNKDKLLIDLITYVLERGHYDAKVIDDNFSKSVYQDYLMALDPLKRFFYQEDIEEFAAFEDQIDDQIKNKEVAFFNLTHDRLQQRMKEVREIYQEILAEPFDFSENEDINTNYEEINYVSSREDLKERWRKQLKFTTLSNFYDKKQEQNGEEVVSLDSYAYEDEDGTVSNPVKPDSAVSSEDKNSEEKEIKTDADLEKEARESTWLLWMNILILAKNLSAKIISLFTSMLSLRNLIRTHFISPHRIRTGLI